MTSFTATPRPVWATTLPLPTWRRITAALGREPDRAAQVLLDLEAFVAGFPGAHRRRYLELVAYHADAGRRLHVAVVRAGDDLLSEHSL